MRNITSFLQLKGLSFQLIITLFIVLAMPLTCSKSNLHAQERSDSLLAYYEAFSLLSPSTGLLLNKTFADHAEVAPFYLPNSNSDLSDRVLFTDFNAWMTLHRKLRRSNCISDSNVIPNLADAFQARAASEVSIPIACLFYDADYIHFDSTEQYLNSDSILIPETPLETVNIFSIANLRSSVASQNVKFLLEPEFLYSNKDDLIVGIEIDFGDGLGISYYPWESKAIDVNYSVHGEKSLVFKLITENDTLTSFSTLKVLQSFNEDFNEKIVVPLDDGMESSISYNVYLGCDDFFDRPIILVQGFQISGPSFPEDIYRKYVNNTLAEYFSLAGYDVVAVGFGDTHLSIEDNAELLKRLILDVNHRKNGHFENIIIAESMGGVIARFALANMESIGEDHDTRLYASFDSPHKGSNTPLSLQETLYDALNADVSSFFSFGLDLVTYGSFKLIFGDFAADIFTDFVEEEIADGAEDAVNDDESEEPDLSLETIVGANSSTSFGEMNYRNRTSENRFSIISEEYVDFQDKLYQVGFPNRCRSVALINGSNVGERQKKEGVFIEEGDDLFREVEKKVTTFALVSYTDKEEEVVSKITRKKGFLGVCRRVFNVQEEGVFSFGSQSYDIAPGSIPGEEFVYTIIPSSSAIGLKDELFYSNMGLTYYDDSSIDPARRRRGLVESNSILFDDIYSQKSNTKHLNMKILIEEGVIDRFKERELMFNHFDLQNTVFEAVDSTFIHGVNIVEVGRDVNDFTDEINGKIIETGKVVVRDEAYLRVTSEKSIHLQPGFEVMNGANLEARILNLDNDCVSSRELLVENQEVGDDILPYQEIKIEEDLNDESVLRLENRKANNNKEGGFWQVTGDEYGLYKKGSDIELTNLPPGQYMVDFSTLDESRYKTKVFRVAPQNAIKKMASKRKILQSSSYLNIVEPEEVFLYPLPVTKEINWNSPHFLNATIFDLHGRLVTSKNEPGRSIDVSNLANGSYLLILEPEDGGFPIRKIFQKQAY